MTNNYHNVVGKLTLDFQRERDRDRDRQTDRQEVGREMKCAIVLTLGNKVVLYWKQKECRDRQEAQTAYKITTYNVNIEIE